jgi:hypothetical protein
MDNAQHCDSYINVSSSQTYRASLEILIADLAENNLRAYLFAL